ncbi:MAG: arsenite methyltransferase [Rubrobacter sp.]|nr:arsenite methyltransferase [Rubrobacter sp.]
MGSEDDVMRDTVRRRYAEAALSVGEGGAGSCCGESSCACSGSDSGASDMTGDGYSADDKGGLPEAAVGASLGCGNPVALAELREGEVVLDLGSGGGIDVLLSAKRVGSEGKAYGLDMTDEMLALAKKNAREAGAGNVEFLKGEIEDIPLPDEHVDVVVSNCVINLSTDKKRVLEEAFRVLRPGGRFAVYDVVFVGDKASLSDETLEAVGLWTGCVAGALEKSEYEAMLSEAGFEDVSVEVAHTHDPDSIAKAHGVDAKDFRGISVASAFARATKPEG